MTTSVSAMERAPSIIEPGEVGPDHLLAVQFGAVAQAGEDARSPEQRLVAAVLEDALRMYCRCAGASGIRSQRLLRETAEWFASHDATWPFAFEAVCDTLGLDGEWLRGLLRRWEQERNPGVVITLPRVRVRVAGTRHTVRGRPLGLRDLARRAS